MKQKLLLLLAISISMVSSAWAEDVSISNASELVTFATRVNDGETTLNGTLTADIDLNGVDWTPIGNSTNKYAGTFDGGGHAITNFSYTATGDNNGLFGYINNATVKNFSISGELTSVYSKNGVVGCIKGSSTVSRIYSSLTINVREYKAHTGGVVGGDGGATTDKPLVEYCEYSGTLNHSGTGDCQAGILGYTGYGTVRNCIFSGTINGETARYAGILGYCKQPSFGGVQNCLSIGKIVVSSDSDNKGAIIGTWNGGATENVKNNYYCLREGSNISRAIGGNTSNCEAPVQVTAEQLGSGEICYALNKNTSNGGWYQTLGTDATPVLFNASLKVYHDTSDYINFTDNQMDIADEDDLVDFATIVNAGGVDLGGVLTDDIDMSSVMATWPTIGNWNTGDITSAYQGHFDGASHEITNFTGSATKNYYGLFGVISTDALIENFSISGTITNSYRYAGGVAGYARETPTIRNVHSSVNISNSYAGGRQGGILGASMEGTITIQNCTYTGNLNAGEKTGNYGGIVGYVNNSTSAYLDITNCLFDGDIQNGTTAEGQCGGVVGYVGANPVTTIQNCLSLGSITAKELGMIGGRVLGANVVYANNYYMEGSVNANGDQSRGDLTATAVSTEQLASGEVAYLLNESTNAGTNWHQNLPASPSGDATPTLDGTHGFVYVNGTVCPDTGAPQGSVSYSNAEGTTIGYHNYVDGFCKYCDTFNPDAFDLVGGYYQIANGTQLRWFASKVNAGTYDAKAILTDDIDMTDVTWTPIGTGSGNVAPGATAYTGIFNGQGYGITGFSVVGTGHLGLFGDADGATIKNFSISGDLTVTGGYCAGVVSNLTNSTIENVHSALTVSVPNAGVHHVGGVVGSARGGNTISKCSFSGSLTVVGSTDNFAGIAAYITSGDNVINCANYGNVTFSATGCSASGVVGYLNSTSAYVQNCLNIGTVTCSGGDPKYGGAIVGRLRSHTASYITNHFWLEDSGYGAAKDNDGKIILTTAPEVTTSQLASGEITYKLGAAWYQTIGTDDEPTLDSSSKQVILNGDYENVASTLALDEDDSFGTNSNFDVTSVTMNRTLKGGKWNTFCVPFDMSSSEISSQLGTDTEVKELTGVTDNGDGNYTLTFDDADGIVAGKPYMVKVTSNVSSISLSSKTIKGTIIPITKDDITFTGVFNNGNAPEDSYIISNNKFYQVNSTVALKAFRGYLAVGGGGEVKELNYFIEDDDADGIDMVNGEGFMVNGPIYNLSGQRINKLQKGINIVNGKKVLF